MKRIIIVEDDRLILELVTDFLIASGKFTAIIPFHTGTDFLEGIEKGLAADLILLDFRLGDMKALDILSFLEKNKVMIPVMVLTSHYEEYLIGYMIKNGVAAYLPKNIPPSHLIEAIDEVIRKGHYIMKEQFPYLKTSFSEGNQEKRKADLTAREIDVIYLLANQMTAKEIAEKLFLAPKTVEGYKNNLFVKTGTRSVVGLVLFAIQNGFIEAESIQL